MAISPQVQSYLFQKLEYVASATTELPGQMLDLLASNVAIGYAKFAIVAQIN